MLMDKLTPTEAVAEALGIFRTSWDATDNSEDPKGWDAACEAWDRFQETPCQNAGDVLAKAAAFTIYRKEVAVENWGFDTICDADFLHLARLFADAARFLENPRVTPSDLVPLRV